MIDSDDSIWGMLFWLYLGGALVITALIPYLDLPLGVKIVVGFADAALYFLAVNAKTHELSLKERCRIFLSGRVWWEQLTFGHRLQPQRMYVSEPLKGK